MPPRLQAANAQRCAIAIMPKAPIAGRSKTRLCPPLTPAEAAALSGAFLRDMAATVLRAAADAPIDLFAAYAPAGAEAALREHLPSAAVLLLADGEGIEDPGVTGFGRPLLQTIRHLLARGYGAACVLNSDSPTLPHESLVEAAGLLAVGSDRAVLGPADDGGYYLLGLRDGHATLFAGIAWSTADVADRTRTQATRAGIAVDELAAWYDVDDAASLHRLIADIDRFGTARAPATAEMLDLLNLRARLSQPA